MLENSSTFSNESSLQPNNLPFASSLSTNINCLIHKSSSRVYGGFYVTFILIIFPLCVPILYHGLQQLRRNRLQAPTASMSHNDCFTYHLVVMQMFGVIGCVVCCCGTYTEVYQFVYFGGFLWLFSSYGETVFHIMTCMERFLAVVYPFTYQGLRKEKGIQIRNKIIPLVWLLCVACSCTVIINTLIPNFIVMIFGLIVVVISSFFVLFVLIRHGPGGTPGFRRSTDKKKQKAYFTITVILGALFLRFVVSVVWLTVTVLKLPNQCLFMMSAVWLTLPSSCMIPLLFLHRTGKKLCQSNI